MFYFKRPVKVPNCKNCKYFIKHNNENFCKLYTYIFVNNEENFKPTNFIRAEECRINDDLCGLSGRNFKEKK